MSSSSCLTVISRLMHDVVLADDPDVFLVEQIEGRPLGNDEHVFERPANFDGAGFAVTQQSVRVRVIRAKLDVPVLIVEVGLDRADLAWLRKRVAVCQHEVDLVFFFALLPVGHVVQVIFLGNVEIDPHHAVIGQGREDVPFFDQAPLALQQAIDDAVERRCDLGEIQLRFGQVRLGLGFRQFGLLEQRLVLGDHLSSTSF